MTLLHRVYKWGALYRKKIRPEGQLACHRLLLQQKVRQFNAGLGAIGPALKSRCILETPGEMEIGGGVNAG
jgi:hypothetical protein